MAALEEACETKESASTCSAEVPAEARRTLQRRLALRVLRDLPTSVEPLKRILESFQHLYNHHRPPQTAAARKPTSCRDPPVSHVLTPDMILPLAGSAV